MTGIYDLSGGEWERSASYVANNHKYLLENAKSLAYNGEVLNTKSTKYTMVYPDDNTLDNSEILNTEENMIKACQANYEKNIKVYGDGVREISENGNGNTSWNAESSNFIGLYYPLILNGGDFWDNSITGSFFFSHTGGESHFHGGFRTIVIPI